MASKRTLILLASLLVANVATADTPITPDLSLSAAFESDRVHDPRDPLLLYVGLANPTALAAEQHNLDVAAVKQALDKGDINTTLRQQFLGTLQQKTVPSFTLGNATSPLAQLVHCELTGPDGNLVPNAARSLSKNAEVPTTIKLDANNAAGFFFGIDADTLSKLPKGPYTIRATLDTRDASDMWQGRAKSQGLTFELQKRRDSAEAELIRDLRAGIYHRIDANADAMEIYARRIQEADPNHPTGWELQGDASVIRERYPEANALYEKAIALYFKRNPSPDAEPPLEIMRKMDRIATRIELPADLTPAVPPEVYRGSPELHPGLNPTP